jgi:pyruvate,water dikinase
MKAENLKILKDNGFNVPPFITVDANGENNDFEDFIQEGKKYAVRSSSSNEDGDRKSFAGQFETLLNVDKANIGNAIDKVRESFNLDNGYAQSLNGDDKIIIQEMVDADMSGVVFTSNPIGILNESVIVAGYGLGCNVVEDKINTTTYYYNQDDELFFYEQNDNSPLLDKGILDCLVYNAKKIRDLFGKPMDIEYCIKDDMVYILQARPITTLEMSNSIILDNSNIVESYPGTSLQLTQSFVKDIYYKIFKYLVLHLTYDESLVNSMEDSLKNMVDIADNKIYYRISNWYTVLNLLPFSKRIIKVWQEMLGVQNKNVSLNEQKVPIRTKVSLLMNFIYYLIKTPSKMEELNKFFEENISRYNKMVSNINDIEGLLALYDELEEGLVQRWDITLINDMYAFIYTHLCRDKESISNIKNLESMKPSIILSQLKEASNKYGFDSKEYNFIKANYINEYGDRILNELKLETKTYKTNPELLDEYVMNDNFFKKYVTSDNIINSKGFFAKRARLGIQNREVSRLNRSKIFGLTRVIFLKIGSIYKSQGILDDEWDVFYFTIDDIRNGNVSGSILERRKLDIEKSKHMPNYSRLVFDKEVVSHTMSNLSQITSSNNLIGIGTSMGVVEGEVYVVNGDMDLNNIPKDKILVTKTTDPGWVLLIRNARGVIAEKGSLLSHTAIVTRELKKPSIVNVKNATTLLKTGMKVKLDANEGIVEVLD